jgi:probable rRNA maturation factor
MANDVRVQLGDALRARRGDAPNADLRRLLVRAARAAVRHEGIRHSEISVTLLDDAEIADMNRRFLSHAGPTDVISFALYEDDEPPVGDIYIGVDQTRRQAAQHGVPVAEELARLTIHGVLHMLGHDHPHGARRLTSRMWRVQEEVLRAVLPS